MKPITLTPPEWEKLKTRLTNDYSPSVILIRSKMREVLGFTERTHTNWLGYFDDASPEQRKAHHHGYNIKIHLDFFDDAKRTLFMLKYSEYFDASRN